MTLSFFLVNFCFIFVAILPVKKFVNAVPTLTFNYTGTSQYFTIPEEVLQLEVKVWAAGGGAGASEVAPNGGTSTGFKGGHGGFSVGLINVRPGDVLKLIVGGYGSGGARNLSLPINTIPHKTGQGGYNGGGDGFGVTYNSATYGPGGGGGASSIIHESSGAAIIVSGGGGGGGSCHNAWCSNHPSGGNGGNGGGKEGEKGYPEDQSKGRGGSSSSIYNTSSLYGGGGGGSIFPGEYGDGFQGNLGGGGGGGSFINMSWIDPSQPYGTWGSFDSLPPNITDEDYRSSVASGGIPMSRSGGGHGGSGLIVINYNKDDSIDNDHGNTIPSCPGGFKLTSMLSAAGHSKECTPCSPGRYSSGDSLNCFECSAGKYAMHGSRFCRTCSAGHYSLENAGKCSICPAGKYSLEGSSACTECPPSEYSFPGSSSCGGCSAN